MGKIKDSIINYIKNFKKQIYLIIFNENQIKEMKLGLVENLDVKCYAKKYFDEYQMREIRYGLEEGLDVKCYAKKCYNSEEMRIIRLNLDKIS